jgi:hypothetical protein
MNPQILSSPDLPAIDTKAGCFRGLISPVRYEFPSQLQEIVQRFQGNQRETWPPWYMRPYLVINSPYRYEQELRFVFGNKKAPEGSYPGSAGCLRPVLLLNK